MNNSSSAGLSPKQHAVDMFSSLGISSARGAHCLNFGCIEFHCIIVSIFNAKQLFMTSINVTKRIFAAGSELAMFMFKCIARVPMS